MTTDSYTNAKVISTKMSQQVQRGRSNTLRGIIGVELVGLVVGLVTVPLLWLPTAQPSFFWLILFYGVGLVGSGVALLLNRKSVDAALYLLMLTTLVVVSLLQWEFGTRNSSAGFFLWVPFIAGLLSNHRVRDVIISSVVSVCLIVGFVVGETGLLYKPLTNIADVQGLSIGIWVGIVAILGAGLIIFSRSLQQAFDEAETKTRELTASLEVLRTTSEVGREVSRSLASITAELSATSRQQASGATEQVAAIVEATSSLEELGETAQHIANNSALVGRAAEQSLELAKEVEVKSEYLNELTEHGQQAVSNVIGAIETVRNRIESLAQRLLTLTERSKEIGNIIDLMRDIADETHLLALNAAIESADGKTTSNEGGRRFGVIAGEVKNLADRSLESAQDVQKVILEVQGAIATAVLAAEEGKKETIRAVNQAYTSGQVISELGRAAEAAVQSSTHIVEAVNQVGTLAEEITLATRQQGSASEQVVLTMRTIQQVAQEGASGVSQVSQTVGRIGELSDRLQNILSTSALQNSLAGIDGNNKDGKSGDSKPELKLQLSAGSPA